jgi:hypothetical protein
MKYLKLLGLAAVAAMALMAFFGASSASATVLCTTTSTPCGTSWHIDTIEASLKSGTTASLHSTGGALEATCTGSTSKATKKSTGSSTTTPVGEVTAANLTWSGCNQTTDTLGGGELEVHTIAGTDNGTVTAKGFEVTVNLGGVSCVFTAGNGIDLGTLTGGANAVLDFNAVVTKKSGSFLCPSDSQWTGQYQVTNHSAVYVEPE